MDFDRLPTNVVSQIFSYLPLRQGVFLGRVNKSFLRMASIFASQIKSIDLTDRIFLRLTPNSFRHLLSLCRKSIEKIKFPDTDWCRQIDNDYLKIFAQLLCPNLIELEIGYAQIDKNLVSDILKNNRNLKRLTWRMLSDVWFAYPKMEAESLKLEKLILSNCDDNSLRSLTGRCPNLRHLEIRNMQGVQKETLNDFFQHCSNLDTLKIYRMDKILFKFETLTSFWNLNNMNTLSIWCQDYQIDDSVLRKISVSFPKLESLELRFLRVTNSGVDRLSNLKHLSKLCLFWNTSNGDIDDGLRKIAECGRLKEADFDINMAETTLITFFRFCHQLKFLSVHSVKNIDSSITAAEILRSFGVWSGICEKNVTVSIGDKDTAAIWISNNVEKVSKELEAVDGHVIHFVHAD